MRNPTLSIILICFYQSSLMAEPSSYEELILEVANTTNISKSLAETVIDATFKEIVGRLEEKKGTSIPEFGRFYVQEKYKKKDSGLKLPKKSRISPRFSMSPELKRKIQGE